MKAVYFDSNVLIDICDGQNNQLKELLLSALSDGDYCFPFSAEHVGEITFGDDDLHIRKRLEFLSELSRDTYFVYNVYEIGFKQQNPFEVYKSLNEVVTSPKPETRFAAFVPYENQKRSQKEFFLKSSELNNLKPREAIQKINDALASFSNPNTLNSKAPRSIEEYLHQGEEIIKQHFSNLWSNLKADPSHMIRDNTIVMLFSLFDSFGFWSDKRSTYEKGSRFADSRHVCNASHFCALVSQDKRMRLKAEAIYTYLKCNVAVYSEEGLTSLLMDQS